MNLNLNLKSENKSSCHGSHRLNVKVGAACLTPMRTSVLHFPQIRCQQPLQNIYT